MSVPFFLTIDTEGDNIWSAPRDISAKNTEKLYRFQSLCEKYDIKPIYLTNYEASINKGFQKFVKEHKDNLEIGLHLHAWNSPPIKPLTQDDYKYQPYLHEYSNDLIIKKIEYLISHLKETFNCDIVSHRGGRYSINSTIIKVLYENGIKIDCSVVPGIDWSSSKGDPSRNGGPNFKGYNPKINVIDDSLIEIPVTTYIVNDYINNLKDTNVLKRILRKFFNYKNLILRSKVDNLDELKKVVKHNLKNECTHLDYIIHSSELVKGYSPLIKTNEEEDVFYKNLEKFFIFLKENNIKSYTFKEYLKECK